jgi:hypothetical protein
MEDESARPPTENLRVCPYFSAEGGPRIGSCLAKPGERIPVHHSYADMYCRAARYERCSLFLQASLTNPELPPVHRHPEPRIARSDESLESSLTTEILSSSEPNPINSTADAEREMGSASTDEPPMSIPAMTLPANGSALPVAPPDVSGMAEPHETAPLRVRNLAGPPPTPLSESHGEEAATSAQVAVKTVIPDKPTIRDVPGEKDINTSGVTVQPEFQTGREESGVIQPFESVPKRSALERPSILNTLPHAPDQKEPRAIAALEVHEPAHTMSQSAIEQWSPPVTDDRLIGGGKGGQVETVSGSFRLPLARRRTRWYVLVVVAVVVVLLFVVRPIRGHTPVHSHSATPLPVVSWHFAPLHGGVDQALITVSNPENAPVDVEIRSAQKGTLVQRVRVPAANAAELALDPRFFRGALFVKANAPIIATRTVVRGGVARYGYGTTTAVRTKP